MKNIVIFASGSGTNAENIILYFKNNNKVKVVAVFSNNPNALVIEKANKLKVPTFVFSRDELKSEVFLQKITAFKPDLIVLAGFLWQFPERIIMAYKNKIINIHPALLPKFGGKGMWGNHVHKAVLEAKEKESGATVHFVTPGIDEGEIILQKSFEISESETVESLAKKIHEVEYEIFPKAINKVFAD